MRRYTFKALRPAAIAIVTRPPSVRMACTNTVHIKAADLNEAVLQAVEEHALTPEAIESVIH